MSKIVYLPLALADLRDIVDYLTDTLKAPQAADDFIDLIDDAVHRLQKYPYSCKVYQALQPMDTEYRMLPVKNCLVFYVTDGELTEIHRVLYNKRDLTRVIK